MSTSEIPTGDVVDNSYAKNTDVHKSTGDVPIPVVGDSKDVGGVAGSQDSDEQLIKDDREAIDSSNIIDSKTRGAKPTGSYSEGPEEDELPAAVRDGDDGTSST